MLKKSRRNKKEDFFNKFLFLAVNNKLYIKRTNSYHRSISHAKTTNYNIKNSKESARDKKKCTDRKVNGEFMKELNGSVSKTG